MFCSRLCYERIDTLPTLLVCAETSTTAASPSSSSTAQPAPPPPPAPYMDVSEGSRWKCTKSLFQPPFRALGLVSVSIPLHMACMCWVDGAISRSLLLLLQISCTRQNQVSACLIAPLRKCNTMFWWGGSSALAATSIPFFPCNWHSDKLVHSSTLAPFPVASRSSSSRLQHTAGGFARGSGR